MIVRNLDQVRSSRRLVKSRGWQSARMLLMNDGMGFSFHITNIDAGADLPMHYTNHLESVYCIAGEGSIEDRTSGEIHAITPGVLYALDKHDPHRLRAKTELTLACVFNPPLSGAEVHDDTGAYPLGAGPAS